MVELTLLDSNCHIVQYFPSVAHRKSTKFISHNSYHTHLGLKIRIKIPHFLTAISFRINLISGQAVGKLMFLSNWVLSPEHSSKIADVGVLAWFSAPCLTGQIPAHRRQPKSPPYCDRLPGATANRICEGRAMELDGFEVGYWFIVGVCGSSDLG